MENERDPAGKRRSFALAAEQTGKMWRKFLLLILASVGSIHCQSTSEYEVRTGETMLPVSESTPNFTGIFCNAEEIRVGKLKTAALDLKQLQCAQNLHTLLAQDVGLTDLTEPLHQWLPKPLHSLIITENALSNISAQVFANLTITDLNLTSNGIKHIAPAAFDFMSNLRTIILDRNELSMFNFTFANCRKLKLISLRHNFFKQLHQGTLRQLKDNVLLSILLSYNAIEVVHKAALDAKQYHEVRLDHNQLTSAQLLIKLLKAELVDLSENRISCLPAEFMQNGISRIKVLNLTGNPLECSCLQDLQRKMRKNIEFQKMSPLLPFGWKITRPSAACRFLSVKKWLLRKKHQIELARKRGWKGYWVCLKGTTLLFYPCESREGRSVEAAPKHLIIVDGAIMQPIPEHPKRDFIFCLSTAFGDAYLFQAPCQVELENWVNSIHSACAAAFARHRGKTGTLHLLQEEIFRLEKAIETDYKLKHMAEMQQSVVMDLEGRQQLGNQVMQWEENLERLHCEQFRLRCYMASLQSGELPNPKVGSTPALRGQGLIRPSLLTHVSRATKNTLNKLGVFTVSSFHAFICARSPSLLNNLLAGRGATKRRPPLLSRSNSGSSRRSLQVFFPFAWYTLKGKQEVCRKQISSRDETEKTIKVSLPDLATTTVFVRESMSVEEFLSSACARKNLNPSEHFVRVKKRKDMEDHNYFVPHRSDLIETYLHTHEVVEVCAKILYQVELSRSTLEQMWGFSVEAELVENADRQDELCCYVSRVEDKSVAMQNGIIKGDEIMVINGSIVSDLDMMYLESVLQEELALCMMMRSARTEPPDISGLMRATDDIIESLVCPPPPTEPPVISDEMISGLIVPAPGKDRYSSDADNQSTIADPSVKVSSRTNSFEIENLLKSAEQVTGFCRSPVETRKAISSTTNPPTSSTPSRQLSDAEKLRKVIMELVDTERTYVKVNQLSKSQLKFQSGTFGFLQHLNSLLENYLEPLKKETFLSGAEINAMFGNIQEIVAFQRQFLRNLEEAVDQEPDFDQFEHPNHFKNILFSIGNTFLYYVNHFKQYSSFCASHSKAQKVLHPNEGNQALQEFLISRNPKQQHSFTLESFLIKPIQRLLKYPLLLQQLRNLTDPNTDQHLHLIEALKGMEKAAEHINEMQRIHEEYGAIFDHLFRQHQKSCKQPIDLSPGDLLYYGGVEWLNISDFLGKIKKGLELHAMCFVFRTAVVFLCKERLRQKKKIMGVTSKAASSEVEIIRYQVLIPVTEVQVRASSAKDMDSHFLWELIHLRSQLQRRSEKTYVLSNSTADFRNAFLKTIRQIIRESVRNMSIPATKPGSGPGMLLVTEQKSEHANSHTLERPKQHVVIQGGSHTLGKPKKPKTQRHSAGNISDHDGENPSGSFRSRSKTLGDAAGMNGLNSNRTPFCTGELPDALQERMNHDRNDAGAKSEGEEDSQSGGQTKAKASLGRTPNHLSLSTTSTLSAGSTGSQARLIQSSHPPEKFQPAQLQELGSPVWKPREGAADSNSHSLSRKGLSSSRKSLAALEPHDQQ
ncbi:hypothetical protein HUJ04_005936 [Dendroctonus ponderosae]|nr:hypothetical protein HUJ04_005936 [Dendroctonus ponderosae]